MNQNIDYTPVALYARVSSDRQDVDLSISAQLRALRDYARKNGYIVAREYVDEAESWRIADRPEFRKMIDEAARPNAAFREILAQEVTRGMREASSRGFWISSHAPYGYNRVMVQDGPKKRPTLEIDPDASRIVKRMFDMAEAGDGTLEIIRTLNNEGIASPRGKLWARTSVHNILTNEAYTGTLVRGFQLRLNHQ